MDDAGTGLVKAAFSEDGGRSFPAPIIVDQGEPLGRVTGTWLEDGTLLVGWFAGDGTDAWLSVAHVRPKGVQGDVLKVAAIDPSRRSGFPTLAGLDESRAILSWTDATGKALQVRTAIIERR